MTRVQQPTPPASIEGLTVDVVDLIGKPGAHRTVERTAPAPDIEATGAAMRIATGTDITVEASFESVVEGIFVTGTAEAELAGECSRCLDPVDDDLSVRFDELFTYPQKVPRDAADDDVDVLTGDEIDLGPLVRDALALETPPQPLCREDCPGLCPQCGFRMEEDPDHAHEVIDSRWAQLEALLPQEPHEPQDGRP
ncbi:MAG: DUF177 domain-containing protein [Brachybacterium sp.]|nr:DUF177 domain-containing protein [Brachybacterium sp.]